MSWALNLSLAQGGLDFAWRLETEARWVGVYGNSGLGKTSLVEALLGWRGTHPRPTGAVGYLHQDVLLMPHWTVAEHFTRLSRAPLALPEAAVLDALGLDELLARPARLLSGGEARRVGLARAILAAGDAGLLVLDEPLEALDRLRRVRVLGMLLDLKEVHTGPAVVVSHRADELALLADVVQRIQAHGTKRELAPPLAPDQALASEGIHENRLSGTITAVSGDSATLRLHAGDVEIIVPSQDLAVGDHGVFGLFGDDVLLGLDDPGRVSARNKLAGHVAELRTAGTYINLIVDLAPGAQLSTHLTHAAVQELALKPGAPVRLFFKTRSVRLLARRT